MKASLLFVNALASASMIALAASSAEVRDGERTTFYFIDEPCPAEIRIHENVEGEGHEVNIEVYRFDEAGLPEAIFDSGLTPPVSQKAGTREYRGRSTLDGAPVSWAISLDSDNHLLRWIAPESVDLRDGETLEFYGSQQGVYREVSNKTRLAHARRVFDQQDKQLTEVYSELKSMSSPQTFQSIRDSQREWLRYRDFWIADGDNADLVGPGSVSHTWLQAKRTLQRVAYLEAWKQLISNEADFDAPGQYADGMGQSLLWRPLPNTEAVSYFLDLRGSAENNPDPLVLWGVASPAGPGEWTSTEGMTGIYSPIGAAPPESVRFRIADNGRITVSLVPNDQKEEPAPRLETGFLRVQDLTPSTEPMRYILAALPDRAFEALTDPLPTIAREKLAATGQTLNPGNGPERHRLNRIEQEDVHYLSTRVPFGELELARYPRPDGSAVIVIIVSRNREQNVSVWEWETGAMNLMPVELMDYFPEVLVTDFYEDGPNDDTTRSAHAFSLKQGVWTLQRTSELAPPTLELSYFASQAEREESEPAYQVHFPWNNVGFGFERIKLTPLFHKTSRASLIFLRRAVSFRRLRISTDTPLPELLALHKNLRRNHFPLL